MGFAVLIGAVGRRRDDRVKVDDVRLLPGGAYAADRDINAVMGEAHAGEAERLAGAVENRLQRIGAAQHSVGHAGEHFRFRGRTLGLPRLLVGPVDDEGHDDAYEDVQHDGHHVLRPEHMQ